VGLGDTVLSDTLPSEHLEQVRLVSWFRKTYPDTRIFAVPNGGARSGLQGAKLKAEGVSPGIPDLFVPAWGLWVEMKRSKGGTLSPDQKDWIAYLDDCGYQCIVGWGFEDAKRQIEDVKKPTEYKVGINWE
tara:strand:- start:1816 stop:2208 length:393 start_codon:yes stop_codon:yes gene_type:complete